MIIAKGNNLLPLDGGEFDAADVLDHVLHDQGRVAQAINPGPTLYIDGTQFMNPMKSDFCLAFMIPVVAQDQIPQKKDSITYVHCLS